MEKFLLGVNDNKKITGIDNDKIDKIKKELVNNLNNPQVISPTVYLSIESITINGKNILYILVPVPVSSQVHICKGKIYDRNEDGDFNITNNNTLVSELYLRKQISYLENKIYPYVVKKDLRLDLMPKIRKIISLNNPDHTWLKLNDD